MKIKLVKMRSYWIRAGPKPNDWCIYKKRKGQREKEKQPCENRGRD